MPAPACSAGRLASRVDRQSTGKARDGACSSARTTHPAQRARRGPHRRTPARRALRSHIAGCPSHRSAGVSSPGDRTSRRWCCSCRSALGRWHARLTSPACPDPQPAASAPAWCRPHRACAVRCAGHAMKQLASVGAIGTVCTVSTRCAPSHPRPHRVTRVRRRARTCPPPARGPCAARCVRPSKRRVLPRLSPAPLRHVTRTLRSRNA